MTTRKNLQSAGTKRTMQLSGLVLIVSWILIVFLLDSTGINGTEFQTGKLGAIGLIGFGLVTASFFIKEKKKG